MAKSSQLRFPFRGSVVRATLPLFVAAALISCTPKSEEATSGRDTYTFNGATMGTTYTLKFVAGDVSADEQHRVHDAVDARLQHVNALMSTYDPESELSRFNAWSSKEPFTVSAELMDVLTRAERIGAESDGAFDVTIGRLVDLWGFGPTEQFKESPPSEMAITKALRQTGYENLHLNSEAGTIAKEYPMMYVDLSAIAKGYGVDHAAEAVEEMGYTDYMLEVGGEVRTRGRNAKGEWWQIAIEEPVAGERKIHRVVPVADMAMATSGDYRNFVEENGIRLSHTIDPATGKPIAHRLASATVLHQECSMADGYATAMMALGPEKGMDMAERLNLPVFLIVHDGENGFEDRMSGAFKDYLNAHAAE